MLFVVVIYICMYVVVSGIVRSSRGGVGVVVVFKLHSFLLL